MFNFKANTSSRVFALKPTTLAVAIASVFALSACTEELGYSGDYADQSADVDTSGSTSTSTDTEDTTTSAENETPEQVILKIGHGFGDTFEQNQLLVGQLALKPGDETLVSVSIVDEQNQPWIGSESNAATVSFYSNCSSLGLSGFSESSVEITGGLAKTNYMPVTCYGADRLYATTEINGVRYTATNDVEIASEDAISLGFASIDRSQLMIQGMGGTDTAIVKFQMMGEFGNPMAGEKVSFTLTQDVAGAQIVEGYETATTNSEGFVTTKVRSGNGPATLVVVASHEETEIRGMSESIVVSTGLPVQSALSMSVEAYNPVNAYNKNGITDGITVHLADQQGNAIPDGTQINFVTPESGQFWEQCTIANGACNVTWISSSPRPVNGRLTIMAFTDGQEDFVDNNGNTYFDEGDDWFPNGQWVDVNNNNMIDGNDIYYRPQDIGEAYVDEDESGSYDLGEFFVDRNSNGLRDAADGAWSGPCHPSIRNNISLCGSDHYVNIWDSSVIALSTPFAQLLSTPLTSHATPATLGAGEAFIVSGVNIGDSNENNLPAGSTIFFEIDVLNDDGGEIKLSSDKPFTVPNSPNAVRGYAGSAIVSKASENGNGSAIMRLKTATTGTDGLEQTLAQWSLSF
ncbi:MAG: hypothetical protein HWE20_11490 [Gammaproteobacteria bacterium]|nr:hypothetical protein [Gammaproteobacteria bacterium]